MSSWVRRPIEDLVAAVQTWNPLRADPNDTFQYIDLSAVGQDEKAIIGAREVACCEAPSRARQLVETNDVLVSTVRPNLNGVARVPDDLEGATASTGFCVLRPVSNILSSSYLFHWVKSPQFVADMVRKATGASYPAVSDRIVAQSQIPLPPLPEQRRIAAILDQADALRAKRREALAELDILTQSIFIEMFGNPIPSRSSWPISQLGTACKKISDGTHHSPPIQPNGIPYITAKHLKGCGLDFYSSPWFVTEDDHRQIYARCDPKPGDVLYIKDGATTGIAAINSYSFEFSMLSSLALLRPNREILNANYLCHWLNNPSVKTELLGAMAGAAIRRLTLAKIKAISIPLPPLQLQTDFEQRAAAIEATKDRQTESLAELDALFAALQHRAFRGEL